MDRQILKTIIGVTWLFFRKNLFVEVCCKCGCCIEVCANHKTNGLVNLSRDGGQQHKAAEHDIDELDGEGLDDEGLDDEGLDSDELDDCPYPFILCGLLFTSFDSLSSRTPWNFIQSRFP